MNKNMETAKESENLRKLFDSLSGRVSRRKFCADHKIPGGDSMVYQIISGRKPISLACALALAKGFGVPLERISERLAEEARQASGMTSGEAERTATVLHLRENTSTRSYASNVDDLIREFSELSPTGQEAIRLMVQQLSFFEKNNK